MPAGFFPRVALLSIGLLPGFFIAGCGSNWANSITIAKPPGGSGGSNPPSGGSSPAVTEYLYVGGEPNLLVFKVKTDTGIPVLIQSLPVVGAASPSGAASIVAASPAKYLYVDNWGMNEIDAYSVASDGTISLVTGSPFTMTSFQPTSGAPGMALAPDGAALYVNQDRPDMITGFQANPATAQLTPLTKNISFDQQNTSGQLIIDPTGSFVYAALWSTGISDGNGNQYAGIAALSIDPVTKNLTPLANSPVRLPPNSDPVGLVIDPAGRFVYVALSGATLIEGFLRNSTTGDLTPVSGSPFPAASTYTSYLSMHPSGKFLYALNGSSYSISSYSINSATGALTLLSASPAGQSYCSPAGPMVVDPSGNYLYASNGSFGLCIYKVNASTGLLTSVIPTAFGVSVEGPASLAIIPAPQ